MPIACCPQRPGHCPDAPLHLSRYNLDVLAPPGSAQAKSVPRATYVPLLGALRSPPASHLSSSAAGLEVALCFKPLPARVPPSPSTLKGCTESRQLHPGKRLRWHGSHPPPPLPIELTNLPTPYMGVRAVSDCKVPALISPSLCYPRYLADPGDGTSAIPSRSTALVLHTLSHCRHHGKC